MLKPNPVLITQVGFSNGVAKRLPACQGGLAGGASFPLSTSIQTHGVQGGVQNTSGCLKKRWVREGAMSLKINPGDGGCGGGGSCSGGGGCWGFWVGWDTNRRGASARVHGSQGRKST